MIQEKTRSLQDRLGDYSRITLFDLEFLDITEAGCVELITDAAAAGVGGWVITPNLDLLRQCVQQPEIMDLVQRADLRVADGMPLVWASKIQKTPFPERVSGSNLVEPVATACAKKGLRMFLLGGAPGVVERAEAALVE